MRKLLLPIALVGWMLVAAGCDDVPTADVTATPVPVPTATPTPTPPPTPLPTPPPTPPPTPTPVPSGTVRLEVTGTSCGGDVRWSVGTSNNGGGEHQTYPWSLSLTGHSGDSVTLRACSDECGSEHDVTVTTSIFWKGTLLQTRSRTEKTRRDHCQPSVSVSATLP